MRIFDIWPWSPTEYLSMFFGERTPRKIIDQKQLDRAMQKPEPWTCLHIDVLNDRRCNQENTGDRCTACNHLKYISDLLKSELEYTPRGLYPESFRAK